VASCVKVTFAELYRSAFAETDPHTKQKLLQEVQSLINSWHLEEQNKRLSPASSTERSSPLERMAS
jgi:hypothetical protein